MERLRKIHVSCAGTDNSQGLFGEGFTREYLDMKLADFPSELSKFCGVFRHGLFSVLGLFCFITIETRLFGVLSII